MSSYSVKTTYNEEGNFGSTDTKTLYAHHNNSSDYVTFYDEKGEIIMVVPDTMDNNILDAINRLYSPHTDSTNQNLVEGVERLTEEEKQLIK